MNILLCVAGMPCAKETVELTGTIARATGASVTLLHVLRRGEQRSEGEETLSAAAEALTGLRVESRVRRGDPVGRILTQIREGEYDLVAVGANQRPDLAQRFLGSVSLQIARRAPIPVLISRAREPEIDRLLICTGGIDVAIPVIEAGAWLARRTGARASLLHVVGSVPEMYAALDELRETLAELLQTDTPLARHLHSGAEILARYGVPSDLRLRYGVVADEILREAEEGGYDLIVVGASGTAGRVRRWLLGDVTYQVADTAPCSVLVVKGSAFPPAPES